ncbi:MAG: beta-lactamase family protein [Gemmatimonadetes bacterium]|nr:beta-lactamase family protein [Gemmatimonadota bacterium]
MSRILAAVGCPRGAAALTGLAVLVTFPAGPLASSPLCAQAAAAAERGRIVRAVDTHALEALATDTVAGITVAVARGSDILVARGYGWADLEQKVPVTAQTVFKIGSVTKQFTATLILGLVDEGKIRLDDEITRFLPDYPTHAQRITIHHLLNHTSGIVPYTGVEGFWDRIGPLALTDAELLATFKDRPLEFTPGARYQYNNSAYYLLGVIIQKVTGVPYRQALRERILEPLGLHDTYYCEDGTIIPLRARGYDVVERKLRNTTFISMETPGAAGALCATALDLVKWSRLLHGGRVVSADSYRKMTTPLTLSEGEQVPYGYALRIDQLAGHRRISHGGGINGFNTALAFFPDDDVVVAVIVNVRNGAGMLADRIAAAVLELPPSAWR